jgi:EAL domain-containing protein (putative c-di-GMP-specific phosphodiesterase class I)
MSVGNGDDPSATGERARLAALKSYEVLDTPPEQVFDEFVKLAAEIGGTPTALISLVDGSRQWFKAKKGLDATQTPRDISFCTHAIKGTDVFVVPDAHKDERFQSNPLVTGSPNVRFYAGAPIISMEGHALGTLCVIDYEPREFPAEQADALMALSRHVMAQLELRRRLLQFTRGNDARRKIIADVRRALERHEFELHYQPTVNLQTGRIESLEALIRWNSPDRGLVPPGEFIPTLEDSGLIIEVGQWVMGRAASDYRSWLSNGLTAPRITVNIAPLQLQHPDFVAHLAAALDPDGMSRVPLDIEISATALAGNHDSVVRKLKEIQALGVQIAIDDFGTRYASLKQLAHLPVDTLKIDRSFISSVTENPEDMTLVSNIISLAHGLNLNVVAKGVETEEQRKLLRLLRCDRMQGYLFSAALPKAKIETVLRKEAAEIAAEWQATLRESAAVVKGPA